MERLIAIAITLIATTSTYAEPAKHSGFTIQQIAEHLGLKGGNWSVKFNEKCYAGFIITDITAAGEKKQFTYWSKDAAFQHEFHFMEHVQDDGTRNDKFHEIDFSSRQIGEPEVEQIGIGELTTQFSFGIGMTYSMLLPRSGMHAHQTNDVEAKIGEPTMLYEFTTTGSKREFRLEIIFATTKPEEKPSRQEAE